MKDAENGKPGKNDCSTDVAPAVFVRIYPYLNWISEKTGMKFEWFIFIFLHFVVTFLTLFSIILKKNIRVIF